MNKVNLFKNLDEETSLLEKYIISMGSNGSSLQILEAGCGQSWPLNLKEINYTLTGLDLDKNALNIRKFRSKDLDEIIVGDLLDIELAENKFDIIYSSYVIEHIHNAKLVLDNLFKWLKPGGLLILRIPDPDSVYGFFAQLTPFWFHVLFRKHIFGCREAGRPGFSPYPTVYDSIVSRKGIYKYCQKNNIDIIEEYGHSHFLKKPNIVRRLLSLIVQMIGLVSMGKLKSEHSNLTYILKKNP